MGIFEEFITSLINLSPIVGLLLFGIWYLYRRNNKLEEKNEELNKFIRDEGIKNTAVLQTVTHTLDKVIDQNEDNYESLKEWLDLKISQKK